MADLSVTAASVLASAAVTGVNARTTAVAGEAIAIGQTVYIDTANSNVIKLADANASALTGTVAGIAITGASAAGQPITYATLDSAFTHGLAGVTAGAVIYQSNTPGAMTITYGDLTSAASYVSVLGVATSATQMKLKPIVTGVVKA
jgi:hypothetical protein